MSQLILSEGATIELDGKKVILKEGDAVQVNRDSSLFNVDKEFEVNTEKGRMLVQPGDRIQVGGDYAVLSPSEFVSDGKKFVLEKGDNIGVVESNPSSAISKPAGGEIIEEGVWDELKRGFGKDTAVEAVAQILGKLLKLGQIIAAKAERAEKQGRGDIYKNLLRSEEMGTLNELYKLYKEGPDGERLSIGDVVDILDLEDPTELINRIRDELVRIGDNRLARRVEEVLPKGIFGKIKQAWQNASGEKMARGGITGRKDDKKPKPNKLDQAIKAATGESEKEKPEEKVGEEKLSVPENINKAVDEVIGKTEKADGKSHEKALKNLWEIMKPLFEKGQVEGSILRTKERTYVIRKYFKAHGTKPTEQQIQNAYKWGMKIDPPRRLKQPKKKKMSPKKEQEEQKE